MMMREKVVIVIAAAVLVVVFSAAEVAADLKAECSDDFQKVMACLSFVQGSSTTPSKECCESVSSIKDKDPKCLCYIIEQSQTGAGAQQLKNLGVQVAKLLQLPSACQLKNSSISDCPKLLDIPASSPEAAIFNNVSTTSVTPTTTARGTSAPQKSDNARSTGNGTFFGILMVPIAVASFLQAHHGGPPIVVF